MTYATDIMALTPAAYWRCDEASGDLIDSSGNGNTAADGGVWTYGVDGALADPNDAITGDGGSGSTFTVANSVSINTGNTLSIVMWIKKTADGVLDNFIDKASAAAGYQWRINASNKLELVWKDTSVIATSVTSITGTDWHMIAVTKTGSTTVIYLDGEEDTGVVSDQTITDTAGSLLISGHFNAGREFPGSLDEISIFPTALSEQNIIDLYAEAGNAPPSNALEGRRRRRFDY